MNTEAREDEEDEEEERGARLASDAELNAELDEEANAGGWRSNRPLSEDTRKTDG